MRLPEHRAAQFAGLRQKETVVEGNLISYTEAGEGPPLLLLHGAVFAGNAFWWETQAALAPHFRTIAPDFPGWGASEKPLRPYTMAFYHRFIEDFLHELGLERVPVVAHSMGGLLGSSFAILHPGRVSSLMTVAVPPAWVDCDVPAMFQPFLVPFLGEAMLAMTPYLGVRNPLGIRRYYETLFHDVAMAPRDRLHEILTHGCELTGDAFHRQAFLSTFRSNQHEFSTERRDRFRDLLPQADFRLLMVAGRHDPLFPVNLFERCQEMQPEARLEVLEACGHFPMWEQADRLVELIKAHAEVGVTSPS